MAKVTPVDRFLAKVVWSDQRHDGTRCLVWTGWITERGYAKFRVDNQRIIAHRWAYERWVGPIPEGLVIDHLCHNADPSCVGGDACPHRRCVNPAHLEAVTLRENTLRGESQAAQNARKTHCKHGHEFTPENTGTDYRGGRYCRTCSRRSKAGWRERMRARRLTDPPAVPLPESE